MKKRKLWELEKQSVYSEGIFYHVFYAVEVFHMNLTYLIVFWPSFSLVRWRSQI